MRRLALSLAVAALALAACGEPSAVLSQVEAEAEAAMAADAAPTDLQFNFFQAAQVDAVGDDYAVARASQGGQLVVVQYTLKNTGRLPVAAFDVPAVRLFDRAGVAYAPDAGLTAALATEPGVVANTKLVSDLNPGITTQGAEVFEISKEAWAAGGWRVGWEGAAKSDLQPVGPAGVP